MLTYQQLDNILDCLVVLNRLHDKGELDSSDLNKFIGGTAAELVDVVQREKINLIRQEKEKDSDATNDTVQFENTY